MMLAEIVETSRRMAETSKRLEKTALLAGLLQRLRPEEIELVVAYLSGRTRQKKTGIGYRALQAAMGPAAEMPRLEVIDVDRALEAISTTQGPGSEQRRRGLLSALLTASTAAEQRFLAGLLTGELRQGALEGLMADAVAKASGISLSRVRHAVMMAGDIAPVARAALEHGEAALAQYSIQLFRPVQPMLAQSAEDIEGAMQELGEAALEFKMDGARVQVHRSGDEVMVFSRQLNDVTAAVPEIVETVRALPARDLILDGEVLSLRPDGRPQPFQITMRRFGRKLQVDRMRSELPLSSFWFDLLYLDGAELLEQPQTRRFAALKALTPPEFLIPGVVTADPAIAGQFLARSLAAGHEGVMAKALDARYAAGGRGQSWLKVKQAHTLDLVILAAEWGSGRRKGWLSNLHLGARDTRKGGFAMLGKTFKGLTDEMLAWQTEELLRLEIGRDAYTVFVEPKLVVEIAFNEIQVSPRYVSGLALRFARVKRYRTDKTVDEADTFETVQRMAGAV
ncbi:MAG TPA: ATP-dependent DNA ligase [Bryobacteraceae bacterium]|nr:ATP-dependent DNA ligase [Bryobacteraceae bacterium]